MQEWADHYAVFDDGCHNWLGAYDHHGYGRFYDRKIKKAVFAHRTAYELFVGPIPEGLTLDHLCRNRGCVNPRHLEPVTHQVNILRGVGLAAQRAKQTHCKRGHELVGENLDLQRRPYDPTGRRSRACKACRKITDAIRQVTRTARTRLARAQS